MASGRPGFNVYERRRLARTKDESLQAVALRLQAARRALNYEQSAIRMTLYPTLEQLLDVQAAEAGTMLPKHFHLDFFRFHHGIRNEFFIEGQISLLPADVELRLFALLSSLAD